MYPNHKEIDQLSLSIIQDKMMKLLDLNQIEISISGDISMKQMQEKTEKYFGVISPKQSTSSSVSTVKPDSVMLKPLGSKNQIQMYLPDSDERAIGYISGPSPNLFGIFSDGNTLLTKLQEKYPTQTYKDYHSHGLFAYFTLSIIQEIINRRLFSVVREERQLTYDANIDFAPIRIANGGYYTISVTSSPEKVQHAIRACKESISSLIEPFGIYSEMIQASKRNILNRFHSEAHSNRFWVEQLSGSQSYSYLNPMNLIDMEKILEKITIEDIQQTMNILNFHEDRMTVCVGIASPEPPQTNKK